MPSTWIDYDCPMAWGTDEAPHRQHLWQRVAHGERAALAELYDLHAPALRRFARRLLVDETAAEDLVHAVFVAAPAALARYRGDGRLESFLLSMAAHKARNHVRAARRQRAALSRMKQEPRPATQTPEAALSDKQLADALGAALDRLPLRQRLAFTLCELEGMSAPEAAEILRVPQATVRTRLFHARKRLRRTLERSLR